MTEKSSTAQIIVAIGEATASIIGTLGVVVFFCGPQILPWCRKK